VALGLIAIAAGSATLFAWSVAVVALAAGTRWWATAAWRHFDVEASFDPPRVFADEATTLRLTIRNEKRLPLPVVSLGVWLPRGLLPGTEAASETVVGYRGMWLPADIAPVEATSAVRGYRRRLFVPGNSEVRLELPVRVTRRGEFWLERVDVEVSDPFRLAPLSLDMVPEAALLVMPQPRIAIPMAVRRRLPFGMPVRAARMFEERERFAGIRPYEAGDPLNRIHWRATAHAGALQTKLFEPTRGAEVLFALDLAVGEPFWDSVYPEIAEDTIGWASFLARQAFQAGWRVGVVANTHFTRGRGAFRIRPSFSRGHEGAVFAALARMPNEPTADMGPVLREFGRRLGRGTTVVLISPRSGPRLREEVAMLRRRGTDLIALSPLDGWPSSREAGA
jgi:uncharacterized protein (DUF58 family)